MRRCRKKWKGSGGDSRMAIELLAPAGSVDALRAACIAGADAVYIGGNRFGARAYADNPDTEELLDAIRLIHRLGKKLYLTVNTLTKDEELPELTEWMRPFYEQGVDAVIVQDLGVVRVFRELFPDLPVHASTQMAVTGPDGVRLLQKLGITRVVPARELSLEELKEIRRETGIELETFIHGALCYSYSGQCLMSSIIGGRSGNRGRCAGICRLPYRAECGNEKSGKELYPLNMKDLCTLSMIPQLIEAGISSFKIEGRMKKPEYTAGVVSVYRKAIDAFLNASWETFDMKKEQEILSALYNRDGFTDGYYFIHNGAGMVALKNEKLQGSRAYAAQKTMEQVRTEMLSGTEAEKSLQMPVQGILRLQTGEQGICRLSAHLQKKGFHGKNEVTVCVRTELLQKARSAQTSEDQIRSQFLKTGGSPFRFEELKTEISPDVFVPVRTVKELRRRALTELEEAVSAEYTRSVPDEEKKKTWVHAGIRTVTDSGSAGTEHMVKLYASVRTGQQADVLLSGAVRKALYAVCLPPELLRYKIKLKEYGIRAILALPYVFRRENPGSIKKIKEMLSEGTWDGVLLRNLEEAGLIAEMRKSCLTVPGEVILDALLYTMNEEAAAVFGEWGFPLRTLPYELNFKELRKQQTKGSQLVIYGRTPMMISAQCIRKTLGCCSGKPGWTGITDRTGRRFPVYCSCDDCSNVIYNSLPTGLLREWESARHLHCGSVRMDFTDESPEKVIRVAASVMSALEPGSRTAEIPADLPVTKGHFRRGVE